MSTIRSHQTQAADQADRSAASRPAADTLPVCPTLKSEGPHDIADMIAAFAGTAGDPVVSAIDGGSAIVRSTTFTEGGLASA